MGGDGTLHEIINGLLNRTDKKIIPIAIIPTGSGNSFSRDIKIDSVNQAIDVIINSNPQYVDLIKVISGNKIIYSCNIIGWGLVNQIGEKAERYRWLGSIRYTIFSIIEVIRFKAKYAKICFNEKQVSDKFSFITISNTIHAGNKMKIAPKAKIDDGLLDIITINHTVSKLKLLTLLPKVYNGNHIKHSEIKYYQRKEITLETKQNENLNIDGEKIGETPFKASILSYKIKIFKF